MNFMGFQQVKHHCFHQCCSPIQGQVQQVELKDQILLDSGSGVKATFMNADLVHNVRPTSAPINMTTNGGETLLDEIATVPGWGDVHFHEDGMAMSLACLTWLRSLESLLTHRKRMLFLCTHQRAL